jgi:hypothetical protein
MFKVFTHGYSLKKECPEIKYRHYFPIATYISFFFLRSNVGKRSVKMILFHVLILCTAEFEVYIGYVQ